MFVYFPQWMVWALFRDIGQWCSSPFLAKLDDSFEFAHTYIQNSGIVPSYSFTQFLLPEHKSLNVDASWPLTITYPPFEQVQAISLLIKRRKKKEANSYNSKSHTRRAQNGGISSLPDTKSSMLYGKLGLKFWIRWPKTGLHPWMKTWLKLETYVFVTSILCNCNRILSTSPYRETIGRNLVTMSSARKKKCYFLERTMKHVLSFY